MLFHCSHLAFLYCNGGVYCIAANSVQCSTMLRIDIVGISSVVTIEFLAPHESLHNQSPRGTKRFGMLRHFATLFLKKAIS